MQGLHFRSHHPLPYWSCWPAPPGTEPHPYLETWRPVMPFGWAAGELGACYSQSKAEVPFPRAGRASPWWLPPLGPAGQPASLSCHLTLTLSCCSQAVSGPLSAIWRG